MRLKLPENANKKRQYVLTRRLDAPSVRANRPCSDLP